jgi:uncharacterized phage protein (TIGR01671 family)
MKNRFKFRVWDVARQIMSDQQYDCLYLINEDGQIGYNDYNGFDALDDKLDICMQCTGIKDINGELIYEGDIVKGLRYHNEPYIVHDVCYHDKSARFLVKLTPLVRLDKIEIMGNKYENPYLLEKV